MIAIVLLLTLIAVFLIPYSRLLFELTAAVLLLVPIEAFILGKFISPSPLLYLSLILLNIGLIYLLLPRGKEPIRFTDAAPLLLWGAAFVIALSFCHQWPDFMSMGERLRDYALLSEVMKYPFSANEPWMTGENLNYYLYWYRFGSFIGNLFGLPVWEMYHLLQAITFSLYIAVAFRILNRLCGFSIWSASLCAVVIGFGSNVEGISFFMKGNENWWGPSRVVPGAINEFPAWSFLLGDLHPHYLNLSLFPLMVLFIYSLWNKDKLAPSIIRVAAFSLAVGPLWIYNANAWEVPVLGIYVGFLIIFGIFAWMISKDRRLFNFGTIESKDLLRVFSIVVVIAGSLYLSSRNITKGGDVFKFVRHPIALTSVTEMFRHWGIPLTLISIATIGLYRDWIYRGIVAVSIIAALLVSPAIVWISFLITFTLIRIFIIEKDDPREFSQILIESLGLLSLALIFIPEVLFMDDPYGGENERMNTIFKAYSADWALIHIYAFYLCSRLIGLFTVPKVFRVGVNIAVFGSLLFFSLGFFQLTQNVRKSRDFHVTPIAQGLSQIDTKYPGAGEALNAFALLPDGITLEAQGNAYSMTSHVSTLGGKRSYLGWMNHVDLLTRKYDESKRRSAITDEVYLSDSCNSIRSILEKENIRYLVVGPLEREHYPNLNIEKFNCLSKLINTQSYLVFERG